MLDNVELIMYMKFQKLLMTGCRDMDKKIKITPKMGFFPYLWPPKIFFKNRALSLLYPYGTLTSCKKLDKTNERSLRYLKTNGRTRAITKDTLGYTGVQNGSVRFQPLWFTIFTLDFRKILGFVLEEIVHMLTERLSDRKAQALRNPPKW